MEVICKQYVLVNFTTQFLGFCPRLFMKMSVLTHTSQKKYRYSTGVESSYSMMMRPFFQSKLQIIQSHINSNQMHCFII
jgi:hypothetical protein